MHVAEHVLRGRVALRAQPAQPLLFELSMLVHWICAAARLRLLLPPPLLCGPSFEAALLCFFVAADICLDARMRDVVRHVGKRPPSGSGTGDGRSGLQKRWARGYLHSNVRKQLSTSDYHISGLGTLFHRTTRIA